MAAKHEAFSWREEANDLQFSLMMEVLPLNNLKIGSTWQGSNINWDNQYCIQSLEAMMYGGKKWLQTRRKLAVVRYLDKLFQPSYTLYTQIMPLLYTAQG